MKTGTTANFDAINTTNKYLKVNYFFKDFYQSENSSMNGREGQKESERDKQTPH